jgi:hypothetical protein
MSEQQQQIPQDLIDAAVAEAQGIMREIEQLPKDLIAGYEQRVIGMDNAIHSIFSQVQTEDQVADASRRAFALMAGEVLKAFVEGMRFQKEKMMQ